MTLNKLLSALLLAASIFAVVELALFVRDLRSTARETSQAITEARGAIADLRSYTREQAARLKDPRNSKAIDAAIQTAAVFNGTGRLINTQVIPRVMKTLDSLADSVASLNVVIQDTGRTVNADLVPGAVRTLESSDAALKELSKTLSEASGRANASLDDIHRLLSDPAWLATLQEIQSISGHVDGVTAEIEESSKQMPSIAANLEKISKTSSKYQRYVILSQIISTLARAFF
jgi:hypothetical protein